MQLQAALDTQKLQQQKLAEVTKRLKDLEQKAKEAGITDLNSNIDLISNTSSQNGNAKGNQSTREKLIREKRIHEQNLVSLRKKITMELQLKKKEIDKYTTQKDNFS